MKAGAKRPLGVSSNLQKEDHPLEKSGESTLSPSYVLVLTLTGKVVKAEPRQPLASRTNGNGTQTRPIAPVPSRSKPVAVYANPDLLPAHVEEEEMVSEMDVDATRLDTIVHMDAQFDDQDSTGEMSDEEEEEEDDEEDWVKLPEEDAIKAHDELQLIRSTFQDDVDMFDTTMVAEYADDIFRHMEQLERETMPNPRYMDFQTEIEW